MEYATGLFKPEQVESEYRLEDYFDEKGRSKEVDGSRIQSQANLIFQPQNIDELEYYLRNLDHNHVIHLTTSLTALAAKLNISPKQLIEDREAVPSHMNEVVSSSGQRGIDKEFISKLDAFLKEVQEVIDVYATLVIKVKEQIALLNKNNFTSFKPKLLEYQSEFRRVSLASKDIQSQHMDLEKEILFREGKHEDHSVPFSKTIKTFAACYQMNSSQIYTDLEKLHETSNEISDFTGTLKNAVAKMKEAPNDFRYYFSFFAYACANEYRPEDYGTETGFSVRYYMNKEIYIDEKLTFTTEGKLRKIGEKEEPLQVPVNKPKKKYFYESGSSDDENDVNSSSAELLTITRRENF